MGTHNDIIALLAGNHGDAKLVEGSGKMGWQWCRLSVNLSEQVAVRTTVAARHSHTDTTR